MKTEALERVRALEAALGYAFPDARLALRALTHKSWANENREEADGDNERLEFLGDAVVAICVSTHLWRECPDAQEGELSRLRASLVNASALATVARRIGLGELLLLGRGEEQTGGRDKTSLLADGLEAVLGAVFLADGLEAAGDVVSRHLLEGAELDLEQRDRDHKTRLQELAQGRYSLTPRYRLVSESGPAHEKVFVAEVVVDEVLACEGEGKTKKAAQQAAARRALQHLEKEVGGEAAPERETPGGDSRGEET
ncbi:MAG: ribonuclease III [Deltaproteobacteria bacterium]|nr:ribonuclease III [Deltaproteobacteria bacterium]